MDGFWKFTQDTLGEYIFEEESLMSNFNLVDFTNLNTYNEELLADNSKGRMPVGKMRIQLKRV